MLVAAMAAAAAKNKSPKPTSETNTSPTPTSISTSKQKDKQQKDAPMGIAAMAAAAARKKNEPPPAMPNLSSNGSDASADNTTYPCGACGESFGKEKFSKSQLAKIKKSEKGRCRDCVDFQRCVDPASQTDITPNSSTEKNETAEQTSKQDIMTIEEMESAINNPQTSVDEKKRLKKRLKKKRQKERKKDALA